MVLGSNCYIYVDEQDMFILKDQAYFLSFNDVLTVASGCNQSEIVTLFRGKLRQTFPLPAQVPLARLQYQRRELETPAEFPDA